MYKTFLILILALSCACQRQVSAPPAEAPLPSPVKTETKGLHNVQRVTNKLLSGSSPEGNDGFRSLQEMGVHSIISVDGAKPEVARASKFGLRYVHLPIGYDGVQEEQALRLARAVRDLPGLVYIHCHHGKHRGPAAAAVIHRCLDEKCGVDMALAEMRRAGTDPRYVGLFAAPAKFHVLGAEELDRVSAEFPESSPVAALAELMVAIDEHWDHLKLARSSGWKSPSGHPDIDPAHEALLLLEQYQEAGRLLQTESKPEELKRWMNQAATEARELEGLLRTGRDGAEKSFQRAGADCTRCHARYRDVPQKSE